MSAAIVKNRQIVWAKGFGHANLEKKTAFSYNGNRFGLLDHVIAGASGRTFCELLVERVIKPLELKRTVPNLLSANNCLLTEPERVQFAENLAQGYTSFGQRPKAYDDYFGASAGLISTVNEVAKYSIAIDNNMFLREETKAMVFSPTISANGKALPYGLGWFVQNYRGVKLV
jgi:CubicO group peptidase (beta-lactamase class C family)